MALIRKTSIKESISFIGEAGSLIDPFDFERSNITIDDKKFDCNGNWAFCRFDDPYIIGARFGFSRGFVSGKDYGFENDQHKNGTSVRIEILTSK